MTTNELMNLLHRHGHEVTEKKAEVLVRVCLFCGNDRWNLELNPDRGVYHCWTCDAGGAINTLLRERFGVDDAGFTVRSIERSETREIAFSDAAMVDMGLVPVPQVPLAQSYLQRRGYFDPDFRRFQLAVCHVPAHRFFGRIVIPLRTYWDQKMIGVSARSFMNRFPKYLTDLPTKRIVGWRRREGTVHVLVEGALDGMRVYQAGFNAAVLLGTSSPELTEWAAFIPSGDKVVVMMDGEAAAAGRRMYHILRTVYPVHLIHLAALPVKLDPASIERPALASFLHTVVMQEHEPQAKENADAH